jgi:hypothetical protein
MSRAERFAQVRQEHGRPAYKRLLSHFEDTGRLLTTAEVRLNFAKKFVRRCERTGKPGVLPLADVLKLGVAPSSVRRWLAELCDVRTATNEADWSVDDGNVTMHGFFLGADHRAGLELRWQAARDASALRTRRSRAKLRGVKFSEREKRGPKPQAERGLRNLSRPIIESGSKKKKSPHPQPTVVPSTAAPEPAAQQSGWCPEESADPLFAGLGGLDPRAWLDAVHAREQQQQGAPDRAAEPEQTDVLADAAWWRQTHAARMPEFDPRFLELARLSRRALTASLAVVLRTSHATKQHAGRRTLRLARAMQETGLITPNAARYARALGGSHARAARRPT